MRESIKRGLDDTIEVILEAQNDREDEVLRELYLSGRIVALGETSGGRAQLILATSPANHRIRQLKNGNYIFDGYICTNSPSLVRYPDGTIKIVEEDKGCQK